MSFWAIDFFSRLSDYEPHPAAAPVGVTPSPRVAGAAALGARTYCPATRTERRVIDSNPEGKLLVETYVDGTLVADGWWDPDIAAFVGLAWGAS